MLAAHGNSPEDIGVVVSSLVFKHLYPDFKKMLKNISSHLHCPIIFDLREGDGFWFEPGGNAYIRNYSKDEVTNIAESMGMFSSVCISTINHGQGFQRMLVELYRDA